MRKGSLGQLGSAGAVAFALFFLAACSGGQIQAVGTFPPGGGKMKDEARPSPDEDPKAPGQIPQECEALLNKSQEWGFVPEKGWKPADLGTALAAVDFFSTFHLVPEATSNFLRAWMNEPAPGSDAAAERALRRFDRAQSCDVLLAHKLLLALVANRWSKGDKPKAAHAFLQFVLNQQTRVAPPLARAVQLDVLDKARRHGLVPPVNGRALGEIKTRLDARVAAGDARAEQAKSTFSQWALTRDDLRASEEARDRLSRLLPLP